MLFVAATAAVVIVVVEMCMIFYNSSMFTNTISCFVALYAFVYAVGKKTTEMLNTTQIK